MVFKNPLKCNIFSGSDQYFDFFIIFYLENRSVNSLVLPTFYDDWVENKRKRILSTVVLFRILKISLLPKGNLSLSLYRLKLYVMSNTFTKHRLKLIL